MATAAEQRVGGFNAQVLANSAWAFAVAVWQALITWKGDERAIAGVLGRMEDQVNLIVIIK